MHILFTSDESLRRTDEIVEYLRGPRLWVPEQDYPDYYAWTERVHGQIKAGEKRAIIAVTSRRVAGVVVYQKHRTLPAMEVKNLTVRPDEQGRYIGSFLLRNAEVECVHELGVNQVVLDAKSRNIAVRMFLLRSGYTPLGTDDLYGLKAGKDTVYSKMLRRS